MRQAILDRIRDGVPVHTAARSCGVSRRTYERWLANGRGEDAREPYRTFAEQVDHAEADWQVAAIRQITEAGNKDWRAPAFMLERRAPDEWADKTRANTTVNVQVTLELERRELSARMLAAAAQVLGENPDLLERFAAAIAGEVVDGSAVELPEIAAA